MNKPLLFDLDFSELVQAVQDWNEPSFRADQIWDGFYLQLYDSPLEISTLSKNVQSKLIEEYSFSALTPISYIQSKDGKTTKTLFELEDGNRIETVLMEYKKRRTLCVSSQAGCAMGCTFCATGQMGFKRNLSPGEIILQILHFAKQLKERNEVVTNIVMMGMGEPFHNYDNTLKAIEILNHPKGFNLGARRFTISTSGIVPGIKKFTQENSQINLAISLHATDDKLRSSMMPVNTKYPINELVAACKEYTAVTHRRITFEWALIQKVNDSVEEAENLADLLKGMLCHVNVIPLNPTQGFSGQRSNRDRIYLFKKTLEDRGIPCTIRMRRGIEIQAGCGQLATNTQ